MITEDDVRTIRKEYKVAPGRYGTNAENIIALAQRFGVSQGTIRRIAHYSMYKWVKDDDE
jgi:hypothetical protein